MLRVGDSFDTYVVVSYVVIERMFDPKITGAKYMFTPGTGSTVFHNQ